MSITKENLEQFKRTNAGADVEAAIASLAVGASFFKDGKTVGGAYTAAKRINAVVTARHGVLNGVEGFLITRVS